jgi:hypothetical protein
MYFPVPMRRNFAICDFLTIKIQPPRSAFLSAQITESSGDAPPAPQTSPLKDQNRVVMLHGGKHGASAGQARSVVLQSGGADPRCAYVPAQKTQPSSDAPLLAKSSRRATSDIYCSEGVRGGFYYRQGCVWGSVRHSTVLSTFERSGACTCIRPQAITSP